MFNEATFREILLPSSGNEYNYVTHIKRKFADLGRNNKISKLFYFVRSSLYFLVVGLSVESCCDDNEGTIINDLYKMNT